MPTITHRVRASCVGATKAVTLPWPPGFGPESRRKVMLFGTFPVILILGGITLLMSRSHSSAW